MELEIKIEEEAGHLACVVSGPFSPENAVRTLQLILAATAKTGKYKTIIDATAVKDAVPAITRLLSAQMIESEMLIYMEHYGHIPDIAFVASEPFYTPTFDPVADFFDTNKLPIQIFTDYDKALKWLLKTDG